MQEATAHSTSGARRVESYMRGRTIAVTATVRMCTVLSLNTKTLLEQNLLAQCEKAIHSGRQSSHHYLHCHYIA